MGFFNKYPYTDLHEVNLDWIIGDIKKLHQDWSDYRVVNSIRFYGIWDITNGYPRWSLVSKDNKGYISVDIVPVGIDINNEDYWKPVADYSALLADMQERIVQIEKAIHDTYVTPEAFGAVGDGIHDDTSAVQEAFDDGRPVLLNNTYLVTASTDMPHRVLISRSNLLVDGVGTLKLNNNDYANYSIIYIPNESKNVTIRNITIIGDSETHTGTTGEWGYGIDIDGCTNCLIYNVTVKNCWGDGIIVDNFDDALGVYSNNDGVTIQNCTVYHNGRNNITVTHGKNIEISGCNLYDAYRTSPKANIDVEADPHGEFVENISIHNNIVHDCNAGIELHGSIETTRYALGRCNAHHNIIFNCISPFVVFGLTAYGNAGIMIDSNYIRSCPIALLGTNCQYRFSNNLVELNGQGDYGVTTGYQSCIIDGNKFTGTVSEALINVKSSYDVIKNNIIEFFNSNKDLFVINAGADNVLIDGNTMLNCSGSSAFIVNGNNAKIVRNTMLNGGFVNAYTCDVNLSAFTIEYNSMIAQYNGPTPPTAKQHFNLLNENE